MKSPARFPIFRRLLAALPGLAALLPSALYAADLVTWPSQYAIRPWETSRLTAADVVGPDGIVYPDFTGVGVTGGVPDINNSTVRATYTVFNVTTYGAKGNDTISDNLSVAAASAAARSFLNANPANKAILYFPAGTYYLSAPVVFTQGNVVIDGDGPASTIIKLQTETGQSGALFAFDRGITSSNFLYATALVARGANTATFDKDPAANGYTVGAWARLLPFVSGAGTTMSDRFSNPDNHYVLTDPYFQTGRYFYAKVTAINSAAKTVTFDRTFTHDYFVNESPNLRLHPFMEQCGLQDLAIETLAATATIDPVLFRGTANSWIKNIKTLKARNWPIILASVTRFEVRDSQFLGTWIFLNQGGGVAYLGWSDVATDSLMENCQASDLRHMAIFQLSNRCVIRNSTFTGESVQSPQLHGRFPHENLVETTTFSTTNSGGGGGTRGVTAYGSDGAFSLEHGVNGPRNVFYNNTVATGMGSVQLKGVSEGFIFAYNRILKTDDIEAMPGILAADRTFDTIVRGNIFQAISTVPLISLEDPTCTGWIVTDNRIYGSNGYLHEGDSTPATASNNRFFSSGTTPAAATTPEVASIYAWQRAHAASARVVLVADKRTVSDAGENVDVTVVRVKSSTASSLTVNLATDIPGLAVPASVSIPSGQTSAVFTVTGVNVTGEQLVNLTATATGHLADIEKISVLDAGGALPNFGAAKWPVPVVGLPASWKAANFGQVTVAGAQSYTVGTDTWNISGGGIRTETFHGSLGRSGRRFVYQTLDGDGEIRARITSATGEQQVGLMIADDESTFTDFVWVEPTGRVYSSNNDATEAVPHGQPIQIAAGGSRIVPSWLRLKRVGSVFTAYRSTVATPAGESDWTVLGTVDLYANTANPANKYKSPAILDQRMHFGMFINSGSATTAATATFTGLQNLGAIVGTEPPPAAPTSLAVAIVGNNQANLSWTDNASDETGFAVEVRIGSSPSWTLLTTVAADATTYAHPALLDGVAYAYRVRALRSTDSAASAYTATVTVATTLTTLPLTPGNVVATGASTGEIQLSWADLAHNEASYQIERSTSAGGGFTLLTTLGAGATGFSDAGLPDGTRYHYRIRTINGLGPSAYAATVHASTRLPAPTEFYITSTSPATIAMSWQETAVNETGYAIERSGVSGAGFAQIATAAANATAFTDPTVSNGIRYYYRIRAINAVSDSDYTAEITAIASAHQPAEFHEPFAHTLGPASLIGRPGSGSGVSGNYAVAPFYQAGERLFAGNIEAGRIPALGNRLQLPGITGTANNSAGVSAQLTPAVKNLVNPPANGSTTFWLCYNYRTASSLDPNRGIAIGLGAMNVRLGYDGKYELTGPVFNYTSPPNSIVPNTSYFVLVKSTLTDTNGNAADGAEQRESRLWVYPAPTLPPLAEPVTGGLHVPNGPNFSGLSVYSSSIDIGGTDSALGQSIDEIRIASTYRQAALPPPPVAAPPVVAAGQSANGTVDNAFSHQITASNTPTGYALANGSLPPGVTLNTATGLLTGTPTATGVFTPGFTATNADGTSPVVAVTITIGNGALIVYEGFNYTIGSTAPDPDGGVNSNNGLPATNLGGTPSGTSTGLHGNHGATLGVAAGLAYAQGQKSLVTVGGAAAPSNATWGSEVYFYRNMTTDPHLARRVGAAVNGNFGVDGQTLFVSLLARSSSTTLRAFRLVLGNGSRNVYVVNTGAGKWSLDDNAAGAVSSTGAFSPNTTALLVLRLTFAAGAADTMSLWVNPPLGESLPITPDATLTIGTDWTFRLINFRPDVLGAMTADEFRMGTTYAAVTPFTLTSGLAAFRTAHGLAADGSQDTAPPAGDGVPNLLKFAFNMLGSDVGQAEDIDIPNASLLTPSTSAGLPFVSIGTGLAADKLQLTYVRRKATTYPGITYTVQFSSDLAAPSASFAANPSATESATSLDPTFERVTVTDSLASPARRFARVRVTAP